MTNENMTTIHDEQIASAPQDPAEIITKTLGMEFPKANAIVIALDEAGYTFVPNKLLATIEKATSNLNALVRAYMKMGMT
jgi:hypothetical protein